MVDDYADAVLTTTMKLCETDLASNSDRPDLLHVRGLLVARESGQAHVGIACLRHAIELAPRVLTYWVDLGDVLMRRGEISGAIRSYLGALTLSPNSAALYSRLAFALHHNGHLTEAEALFRQALVLDAANPLTHVQLGDVLWDRGRTVEALERYEIAERAIAKRPNSDHSRLCATLGRAWLGVGRYDLAVTSFLRGLRTNDDVELHIGLGEAHFGLKDVEAAIPALKAALRLDPLNARASGLLAKAYEETGRMRHAAGAWLACGAAHFLNQTYADAATAYNRARALEPSSLPVLFGRGRAHLALGEPLESIEPLSELLRAVPTHSAAHVDLATARFLSGDDELGWDEFKGHYNPYELHRRGYTQPPWDGSDLNGRTILLWADMGRGDVVQFLRYIPLVAATGGRVIVLCHHPRLIPIVQRVHGAARVVGSGAPLPPFDVHAPLNLFPALVPRFRSQMGPSPYLSVDDGLVRTWGEKLGVDGRPTVGLSWGGNAETISASGRFMPLGAFAPLAGVNHVRLVSLQHGAQTAELLAPPAGLRVDRVLDDDSSIEDVAALMSHMNLVITVDTMIAHLAGALARPVWMLMRYATNWRWRTDGDRTPWYPSMRVFRQTRTGDWSAVVLCARGRLESDF